MKAPLPSLLVCTGIQEPMGAVRSGLFIRTKVVPGAPVPATAAIPPLAVIPESTGGARTGASVVKVCTFVAHRLSSALLARKAKK